MNRLLLLLLALSLPLCLAAEESKVDQAALQHSVEQLRSAIGRWQVQTEFLNEDGSVAKTVDGSYEFEWVVPDRVARGRNEIPELKQASGILFYINEAQGIIEMAAVGRDGKLWVMTGPLGGEERLSQVYASADGGSGQLRFTRFNVEDDSFESRMEYTDDGGKRWKPGNHQLFKRAASVERQK
jgi:hypothetical protein